MPIPVISVAQMREWEKATWATGQTEAEVIRLVGKCAASHALRLTKPGDLILILAGKGNNGADARAAREHLAERRVDLLDVKDPAHALSNLETLLSLRPSLVIDGLFGIGLNRRLSAEWIKFIETINAARCKVLALDVSSGLNAETGSPEGAAICATVTLTVGAPKSGMLKPEAVRHVGRLEVTGPVGLVPCPCKSELVWTLPDDFAGFPPERGVAGHKGSYGHLAIIAGSVGYHGAAVLAARGAQRAQPGLITLYTMEAAYVPIASQLQAVMVSPWRSRAEFPKSCTGIVVGPGLAANDLPPELKPEVQRLWTESALAMLVDASALAWLPAGNIPKDSRRVITPHPGEAARLLDSTTNDVQADRVAALRALSKCYGDCWVVLKGHETLIGRSSGEVFVNSSGNPFLAQGGSGDTLSGYLGGLLAQPELQSQLPKTIAYAVWHHGAAADRLQASGRRWVVEELIDELGAQIL
jgi:ADP-dependent NAD(P)H-hydrate dehydratase / NAD(P)H-hydrate epimerase